MKEDPSPETILERALEIDDPQARIAYLDEACGGDEALHGEVESLLAAHLAADADFMDTLADPVWQEEPTEKTGDKIGRYKLLQQIGEGGFGTVYMAEQAEPVKRRVALKVIKAGMDSKEVIARFEAERQALALMDHPHIAKVHDAGTTDGGRPYFVMELVKGVPLTKYCADKDLDTKARLELFTDVCAAVQHAHQKGVIHRDLKPSNILVSPHDGKPVVKVIDFGIAKAISMELTEKTVFTQLGRMMGTPQYMSPEQAELNALDVDTRSDIYSLGVVLYELLTGTTPLDGTQLRSAAYGEMQRLIREETPPKPSTRVSASRTGPTSPPSRTPDSRRLQGDLDWIVMKALEKDRERRYETANGLAQDLGRHLRNEPVTAGPPTVGYRLTKFVRRNRRSLLSGAVAAVALLVGLAVAGGVWLNATLKDNQRLAEVEGTASTLIEQAERLMEQNAAADYDDDSHFRQVLNLANQLENLVGIEEAGEKVRTRRDRIMARVSSEERDRALILGIEESLMMQIGSGSYGSPAEMEKGIAEAFGQHGSDPIKQPLAETVAWLKPRRDAVRGRILAGMLEWAGLLKDKTPDDAGKLISIVDFIDPDPWRKKLRKAIEEKDRPALEQLASEDDVSQQQIMTVLNLARALSDADATVMAEQLLRGAQREHPESFWFNFALGSSLGKTLESPPASSGFASREEGLSIGVSTLIYELSRDIKLSPEFDEKAGFLRTAVAIRPDAAAGWMNLGTSLMDGGRVEEAVASLQTAIELQPDMAVAFLDLGMALAMQGELDAAIASLRKAIELDPDLAASAYSHIGTVFVMQRKLDEAIASHRKAIKLAPDFAAAHYNLGMALHVQGKFDEAIASYRKAIELDAASAVAHRNLGVALRAQGKLDEAIASYRKAIELDPAYAMAHSNLGMALSMQGKLDEATASYRKAIELEPNLAGTHNNLGMALRMQGKLDEAIASWRKAIELDPDSAEAHGNLGGALMVQGKHVEAIASFRKAIELDPNSAEAHNNLGLALLMQGKVIEAEEPLRETLRLKPNPQLQAFLEFMLTSDRKLLGILKKDGVDHPSVSELVQQLSGTFPFPDAPQDLVRKFWENHPAQVLRDLEQREVTMVMVPKGDGAKKIAEKIREELGKGGTVAAVKEQFAGKATFADPQTELLEDFHLPLQETIFATPVGGVGDIIEFREFLWVIKVHAVIPGKADDFNDPAIEAAAKAAFERQRRERWEKKYMEHLQERIKGKGVGQRGQGVVHLAQITAVPWAKAWKGATLSEVRLVKQKPDLSQPTGLPPAWHAKLTAPNGGTGYLLWDATGTGGLIEFCFDGKLTIDAPNAKAITGVPPLQQFPVPGKDGDLVASGCVPTAAASVLAYWIANGHPQWGGDGKGAVEALAKRLRARLEMRLIPDTDGFTANGMALAGALPDDLARAIQTDADEHKVPITCKFQAFSMKLLKSEIEAGRPVLLSCRVRVPHKPELSWGHEVAAVGWAQLGTTAFVGILDNFFPTKHPEAIRWVRQDAFSSLITVRETSGE